MVKSILTLSIDTELVELARSLKVNLSSEINEYLKARLHTFTATFKEEDLTAAKVKAELEVLRIDQQIKIKKEQEKKKEYDDVMKEFV